MTCRAPETCAVLDFNLGFSSSSFFFYYLFNSARGFYYFTAGQSPLWRVDHCTAQLCHTVIQSVWN